jgi:uncharacterized protein
MPFNISEALANLLSERAQPAPFEARSMNPLALIQKHYDPESELYRILLVHSILVTAKALRLARDFLENHPKTSVDLSFIEEAAMVHDIGIFRCNAPEILCTGTEPYIRHGIIGREIIEQEGYPRHAVVCERHTGVGITRDEIIQQELSLPKRDLMPISIEEKIICLADKFYSKKPKRLYKEKTIGKIRKSLKKRGARITRRFDDLYEEIIS